MKMDGAYQSSRKVGNFIFLLLTVGCPETERSWSQVIAEIAGKKADAGCFYVQKNGTTEVIMASVNLKEPSKAADHMVLLDSGRQVYMGKRLQSICIRWNMSVEKRQKSPSFLIRMECFQQLPETTIKGGDTGYIFYFGKWGRTSYSDNRYQNSLSENRLYLLDAT